MAEIINLRLARKRVERAVREETAAENRTRHGRTGEEKRRDRMETAKAEKFIAGHKRAPRDAN
ncbi:MAG TPA: DUF4169 family protein [Rhizobiaceae bacterium]|nr:DUF4169 family protein [Rhizobiaceae bacterium]